MNKNKDLEKKVYKANALIEAKYKCQYTLHEQKTILWILSNLDRDNLTDEEYQIPIKEYADLLGVDPSNLYREAEEIGGQLLDKRIHIKEGKERIICAWISGMRYKDGRLYVSIYQPLKPYLLELKERYTGYAIKNVLSLNSGYAIRLYEILMQYLKIGSRTVELSELRDMLGIPDNSLVQFVHFKEKVLLISQREINAHTDIYFDWDVKKNGRKITHIVFSISKKQNNNEIINQESKTDKQQELDGATHAGLMEMGFDLTEILKLRKKFDVSKIDEKYQYFLCNKHNVKQPKHWFIKALHEDYNVSDMHDKKREIKLHELRRERNDIFVRISEYRNGVKSIIAEYDLRYKQEQQVLLDGVLQELALFNAKNIDFLAELEVLPKKQQKQK